MATLQICHQSIRLIIEQSTERGVDHDVLAAFERLFAKGIEAGHGGEDSLY